MKKGLVVIVIDNETNKKILNEAYEPGFLGVDRDGEVRTKYFLQKYSGTQTEHVAALLARILEEYPELDMLATFIEKGTDGKASEEETE